MLHHVLWEFYIQSTLKTTKCMTVECLRMLSITTLETTIVTLAVHVAATYIYNDIMNIIKIVM